MQLIEFQATAVANIKAQLLVSTSVLLQSPTGSGKTVIASAVVDDHLAEALANKALILVPTQSLVDQVYRTLKAFGIKAAVLHDTITKSIDGTKFPTPTARSRVVITMPETYLNTVMGQNTLTMPKNWEPTLMMVDEVHKGTSSSFQAVRNRFPKVLVLGLTATPYRAKNEEGEHLRDWFQDNIITTISIKELIEIGRLVQPLYYEFKADEHVVNTWLRHTEGFENKRTIVFSKDTDHSFKLKAAFESAGISAEVITAGSELYNVTQQTSLQRQAIFSRFDSGETQVLISMYALCEGFDEPKAQFCMILREVGNIALYQQMIGRVLRAHASKRNGVILDFGGNVKSFGPVEDHVWTMQDIKKPDSMHLNGRTEVNYGTFVRKSAVHHTCVECSHVFDIKAASECKHCGTAHGVKVSNELGEHLRTELSIEVKDNKALNEMMTRVRAATTANDDLRMVYCKVVNNKTGAKVFCEETGKFNEGFEFLSEVVTKSAHKLSDKIYLN